MSLNRSDVRDLYTNSIDRYASFVSVFQSPLAIQALIRKSNLLREGLRVLDAGCGFGMVTFALLKVLSEKNLDYGTIDAFDLTPGMLTRFRNEVEPRGISRVLLEQADVLNLESLPQSWTNYDLVISGRCSNICPRKTCRARSRATGTARA